MSIIHIIKVKCDCCGETYTPKQIGDRYPLTVRTVRKQAIQNGDFTNYSVGYVGHVDIRNSGMNLYELSVDSNPKKCIDLCPYCSSKFSVVRDGNILKLEEK
jgi:hypothetical protein